MITKCNSNKKLYTIRLENIKSWSIEKLKATRKR